jgi:LCP family protein required for cell wall assembly
VLLLGVDQRGGEPTRSDTIILANLDFERNEARVLSVPRDLYVEIPYGFLWHKINAAYAIGENPERAALVGGGSGLMTATLRYNFGIDVIDEVAVVNFEGFVEGVDALGGIDLIVPRRLVDSRYPDGMRTITVVFEPGQQHMNGARALRYARIRHADSDFGRIQRQQEVILAVQQKASNPAIILKAPSLLSVLRDGALKTSLTLDEQVRLARWGASLPRDRITFYTLPGRIGANERGESVVWANRDEGDAILRAVFGPQAGLERYGDQSP